MEFREKVKQNDEKLRLIFKVNEEVHEAEVIAEASVEVEPVEEEEEEVITLNPNTLYESSDESEPEISNETVAAEHPPQHPPASSAATNKTFLNTTPPVPPQKVGNGKDKKDIFHCRFCDIVFVDEPSCNQHEFERHDTANPFECVVCSFKCPDVRLLRKKSDTWTNFLSNFSTQRSFAISSRNITWRSRTCAPSALKRSTADRTFESTRLFMQVMETSKNLKKRCGCSQKTSYSIYMTHSDPPPL